MVTTMLMFDTDADAGGCQPQKPRIIAMQALQVATSLSSNFANCAAENSDFGLVSKH